MDVCGRHSAPSAAWPVQPSGQRRSAASQPAPVSARLPGWLCSTSAWAHSHSCPAQRVRDTAAVESPCCLDERTLTSLHATPRSVDSCALIPRPPTPIHSSQPSSHRSKWRTPTCLSPLHRSFAMLSSLFVLLSVLGLLAPLVSASDAIFPDCTVAPLQGSPVCDTTLPFAQRAAVRSTEHTAHSTHSYTHRLYARGRPVVRALDSHSALSLCCAALCSGSSVR